MSTLAINTDSNHNVWHSTRRSFAGDDAMIFTEIFREEANIAIWKRTLSDEVKHAVSQILRAKPCFKLVKSISPNQVLSELYGTLGKSPSVNILGNNISELVEMYCCLFDLNKVGLRLTALSQPMCPRFHVDHIPCRLVTTYQGLGTEWLLHNAIDRSKLGGGSRGLPDEHSGLFMRLRDIQRLQVGDVALLKGEQWSGNQSGGLVHRSPSVLPGEPRLLLSLDFIFD